MLKKVKSEKLESYKEFMELQLDSIKEKIEEINGIEDYRFREGSLEDLEMVREMSSVVIEMIKEELTRRDD